MRRHPHLDVSPAETRACPVCGDVLVDAHRLKTYCGRPCASSAAQKRRKDRALGPRQGGQPDPESLPPDDDRPDLYADGWLTGRSDTLRDLRTHLPHDGDPCELCAVLRDVLAVIRGWWTRGENLSAAEGQSVTKLPGGYRL